MQTQAIFFVEVKFSQDISEIRKSSSKKAGNASKTKLKRKKRC